LGATAIIILPDLMSPKLISKGKIIRDILLLALSLAAGGPISIYIMSPKTTSSKEIKSWEISTLAITTLIFFAVLDVQLRIGASVFILALVLTVSILILFFVGQAKERTAEEKLGKEKGDWKESAGKF